MAALEPLAVPIGAPSHIALLTSVWRERTGSITDHMLLNDRLAYGRLYDWLENFNVIGADERDTWHGLREYEVASKLDQAQQMRLHTLIESARGSDRVIQSNWFDLLSVARPLGLKPVHDPRDPSRAMTCANQLIHRLQ